MKRTSMRASADLVAALILFCVYSGCVLMCLMTGAAVYRRTVDEGETRFSSRTTLSYLTARVRAFDEAGRIGLTQFGDGDALALYESIDGVEYVTYVYSLGGQLCELYTEPSLGLPPEAGEIVADAEELRVECIDSTLLAISLGAGDPVYIALSAPPEVTP